MALDSREKRASVVSTNPGAPPSVTPLATPDQEWRQESGWAYSGILVGVAVGQPVMIRMQGVPTMPGYRDRVPKWN